MTEETNPGEIYPVLQCQNEDCRHVDRIGSVPADEEGRPSNVLENYRRDVSNPDDVEQPLIINLGTQ